MATVVNFIDTTLQAAATRTVNAVNAAVLLTPTTNAFHVNNAGVNDPASITFTASLIALDGPVTFSATGGTLTSVTATTAVLTYANMPGATATVTASFTVNGQTYSAPCAVTKVLDGAAGATGATGATGPTGSTGATGSAGASGTQVAPVTLYQWSTSAPAAPLGTSTLTWATGANSAYSAADGWSVAAPTNPGTPGIKLFVATVAVSAAATVTTSTVSYSGAAVSAWSQNGATGATGATGSAGASGVQSGAAIVYQWAATIPSGPAGSATYTWSSGAFGAAPTSWALNPGTSPSAGYTLWQARVALTDSAANATTAFNWTSAAITAAGYAGQAGSSYVTAYCDSVTATTTTTPTATTGSSSVPAVNDGGLTGTWQKTVPTGLASGHYMWQSDGIYNPATNQVSWSIPYWSYAKFGSLSAITANLGQITAGSIDIGTGTTSWHVDTVGNTWAGASTYAAAPYQVSNAGVALFKSATFQTSGGVTVLDAVGLKTGYEAPGTKNVEAQFSPIKAYEFRNTLDGWTAAGATLATGVDSVVLTSTGVDPTIVSPAVSINGAVTNKIRMRVRRTNAATTWQGQVYYVTAAHGTVEAYTKIIPDTTSAVWSILEWDMEALTVGGTDWVTSTITSIRIDLAAGNTEAFEIDWITFGKFGPVLIGDLGYTGALNATYTTNTTQLTDGANLGGTAVWTGVTSRPANVAALAGTEAIQNSGVTLTAGGVLQGAGGGTVTIGGLGYSGAMNATNGAPAGTNVGSTLAQTVEANAANALANAATANNGLTTKLNNSAADILTGVMTINTNGAVQVGTAAWTGASATGTGVVISPNGIAGVNAGTAQFTITSSGSATFGGALQAATGTFGAVTIAAGGSISSGQTAYDTGTGWWQGIVAGVPKSSMGIAGGAGWKWDGTNIIITGATINAPILDSFTAGALSALTVTGVNGTRTYGSRTAVPTGGKSPYTYHWSIDVADPGVKIANIDTATVTVSGTGTNIQLAASINCAITDANNRVVSTGFSLLATHGTPP